MLSFFAVIMEYKYLEKKFGRRGINWELKRQALINKDGKFYDELVIRFADGTEKTFYFDITPYFKGGCGMKPIVKGSYIEGWLKLQVSDLEKALKIALKHDIDAKISTKSKIIELDLDIGNLTIEKLISIFKDLDPICVPIEDSLLDFLEEEEEGKENNDEESGNNS